MPLTRPLLLLAFTAALLGRPARAQDPPAAPTLEDVRAAAFEARDYERARALARALLAARPEDDEARIFLARLYAWDRRFDEARRALDVVLQQERPPRDAFLARSDVDLWAGAPEAARAWSTRGLQLYPDDPELHYRQGQARAALGDEAGALAAFEAALARDPDYEPAQTALIRLRHRTEPARLAAAAAYTYDYFDQTFSPWQAAQLDVKVRTAWAPLIGRVVYADRFDRTGVLLEAEAYPRLTRRMYAAVAAGYSASDLFARWTGQLIVYRSLGRGFEGGAGVRFLHFADTDVPLYTAYVGKYYGAYWFFLRPLVAVKEEDTSVNVAAGARWYLDGAETYVTFTLGAGASGADLSVDRLYDAGGFDRLQTKRLQVDARKQVAPEVFVEGRVGVEDNLFAADQHRRRYSFGLGVEAGF